MNTLFVVATPIGNLEDITFRAVRILMEIPVIACEDTRRTGLLIKLLREKYGTGSHIVTKKKYISVRDWNESGQINRLLAELSMGDVALVSDAGTPLLSDPGYKLVRGVIEAGYKLVPVPGVSAITTALSASGLPTDKFKFWGFLNRDEIPDLESGVTHVFFESPKRIGRLIGRLREKYPEAEAAAGKEMTKLHEEFLRGNELSELVSGEPKGEIVLLVRV